MVAPAFADIDGDGDFDIMSGDYYGNFTYYENTGTAASPAFAASVANPFNLSNLGYGGRNTPTFGDLDNDGDFDMMVGSNLGTGMPYDYSQGNIYYYENIGDANNPDFDAPVMNALGITIPSITYTYGPYTYTYGLADQSDPTLVDIDNDGDLDMYVGNGEYYGDIYFYENTGDASNPAFALPLVAASIGSYALTPDFADIDNDGDFDMFNGEIEGNIYFSENIGTNVAPVFAAEIQNAFTDLQDIGYYANIEFVDLDDDGDLDLLVGELYSAFYYFEQCTAPLAPTDDTPSGDLTICSSETTTLMAGGLGTLGWYDAASGGNYLGNGSSFTTGVLSSDMTYYVQDSTCVEGPRTAIDVTVNPLPDNGTSLSGITLSADLTGATYQWVVCPGYTNASGTSTSQNYTPSVDGDYAVIVTNLGCSDTSTCTTISGVGLEQYEPLTNFNVYPNPTEGNFTLDLGQNFDQVTVLVSNSLGQIVLNNSYNEQQLINIQLNDETGIYFVEVLTSEGLRSKVKLVVK
ncbi:MAG: T9SS type A sorting domain-containing protein [Crocinitomicaceae bacterium]|nr:T9SS type A sorting domain-containing protein [Crocinitomicaceae bacterium]